MKPVTIAVLVYILLINGTGFFSMGADKRKAVKDAWRTPEKRLFLYAALGGSFGSFLGMYVFHHKTKHRRFQIGMPVLCIVWILILFFVLCR